MTHIFTFYNCRLVTFAAAARGPAPSLSRGREGHVPACSSGGRATYSLNRERERDFSEAAEHELSTSCRHYIDNRSVSTPHRFTDWPDDVARLHSRAAVVLTAILLVSGPDFCVFLWLREDSTDRGGSHGFLRHLEAHLL